MKVEKLDSASELVGEKTEQALLTEVATVTRRYNTRRAASGTITTTVEGKKRQRSCSIEAKPKQPVAFVEYNGKVEYYTQFQDIASASAQLL